MKNIFVLFLIVFSLSIGFKTKSYANDIVDVIEKMGNGELPVSADKAATLLPFAHEWDIQAAKVTGKNVLVPPSQYKGLVRDDESWVNDSVKALTKNDDLVAYFSSKDIKAAFDQTYFYAREQGSPVGLIPYNQALELWMASQAISAGPDDLSKWDKDIGLLWCLPPIIRCTPPKPAPKE